MLFFSLTACANGEYVDTQTNSVLPSTTPSTVASTEEPEPPTTEATPLANRLSFADYMAWLESYAEKTNVVGVTDLSSSQLESNPNLTTYSCDYADGLIHLNMLTEGGNIANIFAMVSPYTLVDRGECSNISDAVVIAHALTLVPIFGINENWNYEWHGQQFLNAPEQGSSATNERTYTKDNWSFTVIMGSALVSISAFDNSIS